MLLADFAGFGLTVHWTLGKLHCPRIGWRKLVIL